MGALIWPAIFVIAVLASGACILTAAIILGVALGEWTRDRLFPRSENVNAVPADRSVRRPRARRSRSDDTQVLVTPDLSGPPRADRPEPGRGVGQTYHSRASLSLPIPKEMRFYDTDTHFIYPYPAD